jgi:hypothetical protein
MILNGENLSLKFFLQQEMYLSDPLNQHSKCGADPCFKANLKVAITASYAFQDYASWNLF